MVRAAVPDAGSPSTPATGPGSGRVRLARGLPPEPTSFVGRESELAQIDRLLRSARLLTLTGTAGAGKSRTARRAAAAALPDFAHGVRLVELSAVRDAGLLVRTVADALGVGYQTARPQLEVIRDYLVDRRLLLVLDGCEPLIEDCAQLTATLLRAAPEVRVLATSRQPLRITGEHVFPLRPLPVSRPDDPHRGDSDPPPADAVALFAERAATAGFQVGPGDVEAVTRLCRRLDGIPLAIELAAGRLRSMSLDQLLAGLDDRFTLLVGGEAAAVPERHQTLRVAIGWSHEHCTPAERLLWARLSVFAGDFDLAAAESICADDDLPVDDIVDLVSGLVDKSIVVRDHSLLPRYRMLDSLLEYGRETLRHLGEETALRRRHRDWYADLVQRAETALRGPDQVACRERLAAEHANIRAALELCYTEPGEAEAGLAIAAALWPHWIIGGYAAEGRQWLQRGLTLVPAPNPLRPRALWMAGHLATLQGDYAAAREFLDESNSLAELSGDESALASAVQYAAGVASHEGDHSRAIMLYNDALARHRAMGNEIGSMFTAAQLALCYCLRGDTERHDLERALELSEEALRMQAESGQPGERWCRSNLLFTHALSLWSLGRPRAARDAVAESVRLKRPLADRLGLGMNLELLAWMDAGGGRHERAAVLIGAARRIWREIGITLSARPQLIVRHREARRQVHDALGSAGTGRAIDNGMELTLDEAAGYALTDTDTDTE